MKRNRSIFFCLVVISLLLFVPTRTYAGTHPLDGAGGQVGPSSGSRVVSIPVKVVFVGIDPATVDLSYSKWNVNIPSTIFGQVLAPQPYLTGVTYKINYSYTFASDAYKAKLISYLHRIEVVRTAVNPWFYYYVQDPSTGYITQRFHASAYVVYDANKVENWIYSNQQDLGGFPANGWTLMFMNLPELPSYDFQSYKDFLNSQRYALPNGTAHYFGVSYTDVDLGYRLRYRDFMSGWGGVHRLWFNDLSAGPCFESSPEELPLQIALQDNNYDLHTPYGKLWFTEYLADYVSQAMLNLITPALLYEPVYSQKYSFDVHIFDNRTSAEKAGVDIRSTIDANTITKAFEDLLPYSKVGVTVNFEDLAKHPSLQAMMHSSYKYADSFTMGVEYAQAQRYGVVDARPIYKYFQDNINVFEPTFRHDRPEFTVPVFAFAFSNTTTLVVTDKWIITPIGGIALGDIAFVSFSQNEFVRGNLITPRQPNKGLGFTHDVIHEAGHMLGLPHPFDFGAVGNFVLTPMSYYTWDYFFGQEDKDSLHRAHVDSIYLRVESTINQLTLRSVDVSSIRNQLKDVNAKYNQMDYEAALQSVLQAESTANNMLSGMSQGLGPQATGTTTLALAASVGLIAGFVIAWVVLKKGGLTFRTRTHRPRTAARGRRRRPS